MRSHRLGLSMLVIALAVSVSLLGACGGSPTRPGATPSPSPTPLLKGAWHVAAASRDMPAGLSSSAHDEWYDVASTAPGNAWVLGVDGLIYATADGGATWTPRSGVGLGNGSTGSAAICAVGGHVWGVDAGTRVVSSADGGVTWSKYSAPVADLAGVAFCDSRTGWAVGGGSIIQTSDGGVTWRRQDVPIGRLAQDDGLIAVDCVDARHAWAARQRVTMAQGGSPAASATVYGTTDGGITWRKLWSARIGVAAIDFVDADHGWLAGGDGIWETTDGGRTWRHLRRAGGWIEGISFVDARHGWATSFPHAHHPAAVLQTIDGGRHWTRTTLRSLGLGGSFSHVWGVAFSDVDHGWAVGWADGGPLILRYEPAD